MHEKYHRLQEYFRHAGSAVIAFSGGVDSAFLLKAAHDELGDRALAVTAASPLFPERELNEAEAFCKKEGIRQVVFPSNEMEIEGFRGNPKNRCYLCKHALFDEIMKIAAEHGIPHVCEGSNLDDEGDYRPGLKAIRELGIESPLRTCGFTKAEIRALSKELGLPTWDKQSFACLASRFVYGETISEERLQMVDRAEQLLLDLGFQQVRVRIHGDMARIEVGPDEIAKLLEEKTRIKIEKELKSYGFSYVAVDLKGYRMGSMNRGVAKVTRY
ncbi:MAG: ATP-dependent sacrificial sulfur transferase LarE [Lachnospiraceae bacterium]|nr:ATP-dependent sacrificial sulfur transferase LarE [Lachnospiraceae bacterium]